MNVRKIVTACWYMEAAPVVASCRVCSAGDGRMNPAYVKDDFVPVIVCNLSAVFTVSVDNDEVCVLLRSLGLSTRSLSEWNLSQEFFIRANLARLCTLSCLISWPASRIWLLYRNNRSGWLSSVMNIERSGMNKFIAVYS
jgi:hypothetical protein